MTTKDKAELILTCLGIIAFVVAAITWIAKRVLLPWIVEHIAKPVQETNKQITVNGHSTYPPTLMDKIDNLSRSAEDARIAAMTVGNMLEGHLNRSDDEWGHIWNAIHAIERRTTKND